MVGGGLLGQVLTQDTTKKLANLQTCNVKDTSIKPRMGHLYLYNFSLPLSTVQFPKDTRHQTPDTRLCQTLHQATIPFDNTTRQCYTTLWYTVVHCGEFRKGQKRPKKKVACSKRGPCHRSVVPREAPGKPQGSPRKPQGSAGGAGSH